jgi:hypothetical protein
MRRLAVIVLLPLLLAACGGGFFKIPKEEYRQTVRTLGVVPLLVDEGSTIVHPERQAVLDLLRRSSAGKEERLAELIRERKGYFDVRTVSAEPGTLYARLVRSGTLRGSGSEQYRHYDFEPAAVAELARRHVVDALLVVVINGVELSQKRWDRMHLNYLEARFNPVQATAAVVLPSGEVIWEWPGSGGEPLLDLQYPDFDEAFYNRTEEVKVKFISLPGLERTLNEEPKGLLGGKPFSARYQQLFGDIAGALQPGLLNPFKKEPAAGDKAAAR